MQQTTTLRPYLKGKLEIHTLVDAKTGETTELFTLASLADVLGISRTTLEGRYNRTNAKIHKVDIPNGPGRPIRGFRMDLLETIIHAFTSSGASFAGHAVNTPPPEPGTAQFTEYKGERYYTPAALADYYGVSVSTIRNRLRDSGMMGRLVNLVEHPRAGRPPVALHEKDLADAHLAIHHKITMADDDAAELARNTARAFPDSVPAPQPPRLTPLTPRPMPPASEPNLILDALRDAKMTSEFRQQKPTHSQLETEELTRELTEWLDSLPKTEPTVELTDVVIPRQAYDSAQAQWIQATDPYKWVEELSVALNRLITRRTLPEYDWLEQVESTHMNGIGEKLGLTVSIPHVTAYVEAKRANLRRYLQPYEQLILTAMDDFFPEGGQPDAVTALAFFRAMYKVPVFEGQIPVGEFEARIQTYGNKGAWQALRRPKNDVEQAAKEHALDSPKFHEATAMFDAAFAQGIAECDKEHHINTRLSQERKGWLEFPFDVTYDYQHRNHTP